MKRSIALILVIAAVLTVFSSCSGSEFTGGKEYFFSHGTVFTSALETLLGSFAGCDISRLIPKGNDVADIDLNINVNNIKINGNDNAKPQGSLNVSAQFDGRSNMALSADGDLFGQNMAVRLYNKDSEMYADLGISHTDILYYAPETKQTFDFISKIYSYIINNVKEDAFKAGSEEYSVENISFDTGCVTYYVNSDELSLLLYFMADEIKGSENRFFKYLADEIKSYANKVRSCRIHLEWKRYYKNDAIVREKITVINPDNRLIEIDAKIAEKDSKKLVEITVDGADDTGNFTIGGIAIEKTDETSKINIRYNNKVVYIILEKGENNLRTGTLTTGYIGDDNNYHETQIALSVEDIRPGDDGFGARIKLSPISPNVEIDAEFVLEASCGGNNVIETPDMDKFNSKTFTSDYRVTNLMFFGLKSLKEKIANIISVFKGESLSLDKVELTPYEFDEEFSEEEIETSGEYGKKLVELLMSDKYSYCFDYISNSTEEHYSERSETYFDNSKRFYYTEYHDGSTTKEYIINNVKYAVIDAEKKIVTTSYTEVEVNRYYPRTIYYYANSGKSVHDGKEYIYENYYDRSGNQYHMMFLDGKLSIMWIKDISTKEILYTFNLEISGDVPEGKFDMPKDYSVVGVVDYYGT